MCRVLNRPRKFWNGGTPRWLTPGTLFGPRCQPLLPSFSSSARLPVTTAGPEPRSSTPESIRPHTSR